VGCGVIRKLLNNLLAPSNTLKLITESEAKNVHSALDVLWNPEFVMEATQETIDAKVAVVLCTVPMPGLVIPEGTHLHRCRVSIRDTDYQNVNDLSYRRDSENIVNYGRVNKPNEAVFYCSTTIPICVMETLHSHGITHQSLRMCVSTWKTDRRLIALEAIDFLEAKRLAELESQLFPGQQNWLNSHSNLEQKLFERIYDWWNFYFTNEAFHPGQYRITNAIAEHAFSRGCDAILYQTVKLPYMTVFLHHPSEAEEPITKRLLELGIYRRLSSHNVAIKPRTVDEALRFDTAHSFEMTHRGEGKYFQTKRRDLIGVRDGRLFWGA
jgi:hypothetical protein